MKKDNEQRKDRFVVPDNWDDMTEEEQDDFIDEFIRSVFPPPDQQD
jgi:hypothetical protein